MKTLFLTLLSIVMISQIGYTQSLKIENMKVDIADFDTSAKTINIQFVVSWEDSWYDLVNWDAAWIVLKGYNNGNASEHILISEKPEVVSNNFSAARGFRAVRTMENE